jgi:hypothetical protein
MVTLFWVELLSLAEYGLGLGCTIEPYFIHVGTRYTITLVPC